MAVPHDALYHLNHDMPVMEDYRLGTELNKGIADIATVNTRLHPNAVLDVAAGLIIGTNDLTIKVANAFHYTIDGGVYLKGATDNIALSGASALACAVSKFAAYLITVNATGAIALIKGADATSAALALAAVGAVTVPNTVAPVGIIHVQNSGGAIFTPGATAAGLGDFADDTTADTYIDFVGVAHNAIGVEPTMTWETITSA